MDQAAMQMLDVAQHMYARNTTAADAATATRPASYKAIGISLAVGSGLFIGTSFVLKKVGLIKANSKYNEVAGEGYGYLKNVYWWSGMTLMIVGELLNFVAYAFTDAILVAPMGALSVVITSVLSAIFLKERLSMVGKVACFLCIVGSVVIALNAPQESSVADIQEMQHYVVTPGFLSYAGVIIVGAFVTALYAGPRWGKKNMLVYISICSWIGGLSVVATQGLGSAIVAQAGGTPQFNQWFTYVVLVFVVITLVTEIVFLNKALNLYNAAMVTPTYYVYFTSTTIITSAVLFQGFKGTATSIITVVMGFLVICAGVVLLQLSKSAKDVPDTAVFSGDLNQIHTIAEQELPETEPQADAIRGTAAIIRRFSTIRQQREREEFKRLREEKIRETLDPVGEDGKPEWEWDGLRRRKTVLGSQRARSLTSPTTFRSTAPPPQSPAHPPLGMSHFPTQEELDELDRPLSPRLSSLVGTIRTRAKSIIRSEQPVGQEPPKPQSPMHHPVQLTEISVASHGEPPGPHYGHYERYGLPAGSNTAYEGGSGVSVSGGSGRRVQFGGSSVLSRASDASSSPPTPPPHSAKRQFSFQNVFKRHPDQHHRPHTMDGAHDPHRPTSRMGLGSRGYSSPQVKRATEEERLGLVKGDTNTSASMPILQRYGDGDSDDSPVERDSEVGAKEGLYGRGLTDSPSRWAGGEEEKSHGYEPPRSRSGSGPWHIGPPPPGGPPPGNAFL